MTPTDHARTRPVLHIVNDCSLGGVMLALKNFEHPVLNECFEHRIVNLSDLNKTRIRPGSIMVIHFTVSWISLYRLIDMRRRSGLQRIILVEHSYTQGFEENCVQNRSRFRMMLRLAYSLVDQIVAVSDAQYAWLLKAKLANRNKLFLIPQARDCSDLLALPLKGREDGPLRLGAYGRFHDQKGFDILIKAMARINPAIACLEIVGYGDQREILEGLAASLPHVQIQPPFKSAATFLNDIDVVCIPSRWEAFGLVGAEARAAGRPLIAAQIDGLKAQTGAHSWQHRPNDPDDIRRAILQAANANDLPARGMRARLHVSGEFSDMLRHWTGLLKRQSSPSDVEA